MNFIRPRSRKIPVLRDDNGELSGFQTEHWDDRVDATVLMPQTIKRTLRASVAGEQFSLAPGEADIIRKVNEKRNG